MQKSVLWYLIRFVCVGTVKSVAAKKYLNRYYTSWVFHFLWLLLDLSKTCKNENSNCIITFSPKYTTIIFLWFGQLFNFENFQIRFNIRKNNEIPVHVDYKAVHAVDLLALIQLVSSTLPIVLNNLVVVLVVLIPVVVAAVALVGSFDGVVDVAGIAADSTDPGLVGDLDTLMRTIGHW